MFVTILQGGQILSFNHSSKVMIMGCHASGNPSLLGIYLVSRWRPPELILSFVKRDFSKNELLDSC